MRHVARQSARSASCPSYRDGRLAPVRPAACDLGAHLAFDHHLHHGVSRDRGARALAIHERPTRAAAPARKTARAVAGEIQPTAVYGVEAAALPAPAPRALLSAGAPLRQAV
eukprot:9769866-Alexandrium_andersonii.AAC.1